MQPSDEQLFRQKLRDRLAGPRLPKSMKLRYRLSGGMPSERLEEEFALSGDGLAKVRRRDLLVEHNTQRGSSRLSEEETRQLFQGLEAGLDSLLRPHQAEFLPDSVVGSLTLEVGGQAMIFYFPVEENKPPSGFGAGTSMQPAFQRIDMLARQMLKKRGGA